MQDSLASMQGTRAATETLGSLRWEDVRLFLALFREGSLAPAGKLLGVDPSTASRRLVALEEALGTRLFDRTREGLRATFAAESLLTAAEHMEAGALAFARDASGFERAISGRVRVSAPPGISDVFLADAVPALIARHPLLVLDIDARIAVADLARREADLALRTLRPRGQELVQKRLLTSRPLLLGAPSYVASLGKLTRFADARYVLFGEELSARLVGSWLKKHMAQAPIVLRSDSFVCQLRAAAAGAGLVFASAQYKAAYALVEVPLGPRLREAMAELPESELWLVGHQATRDVPRISAVWTFLDELFCGVTDEHAVRARLLRVDR